MNVIAGFVSIKFIPLPFVLGHNNLNPKFSLEEDKITGKVLIRNFSISYDKIESFSIKKDLISIQIQGSIWTKIWKLGNKDEITQAKELLISKGVTYK